MSILLLFSIKSLLILSASLLTTGKWFAASVRHLILLTALLSVPLVLILTVADSAMLAIEAPPVIADWAATQHPGSAASAVEESLSQSAFPIYGIVGVYALVCFTLLFYWIVQIAKTTSWIHQTSLLRGEQLTSRTKGRVALHQSDTGGTPVSWGLLRPKVVVPVDWKNWSADKRQAVLGHELAHIDRLDTVSLLLSAFVCCVFWFIPLVWVVHRRMQAEAEHACDDIVVTDGMSPTIYADQLVAVARTKRPGLALAMASSSTLSRRIHALLDGNARRIGMNMRRFALVLSVALLGVLPIGCAQVSEVQKQPSSSADSVEIRKQIKVVSDRQTKAAQTLVLSLKVELARVVEAELDSKKRINVILVDRSLHERPHKLVGELKLDNLRFEVEFASLEGIDASQLSQKQLDELKVRLQGLRGEAQTIEDILERVTK